MITASLIASTGYSNLSSRSPVSGLIITLFFIFLVIKSIVFLIISLIVPVIFLLSVNLSPKSPTSPILNPGITIAFTTNCGNNNSGHIPKQSNPAIVGLYTLSILTIIPNLLNAILSSLILEKLGLSFLILFR